MSNPDKESGPTDMLLVHHVLGIVSFIFFCNFEKFAFKVRHDYLYCRKIPFVRLYVGEVLVDPISAVRNTIQLAAH